ncbi:thiolase-like protein [Rhizoclosmatium globosum]|uniref:propanoyl-CoA C-acyltransferase n=1 Tax=Rhizoclosmatium globosum TaxID=329046 RepID=A0A1Y2BVL1_9FUNG|nr:thiolase-like protein [Rhizoclosmatium globosum]|eukprot:ORY38135.1 thiolase-like protein [Rhizoclosmatium globosum]
MAANKTFVIGVGMTHFDKPGRKADVDYPDYVLEAATKALLDANISYDAVQFAAVGYINADSTAGQRGLYQLGLTQIPIVNVNNNCSTGSAALFLARNAVLSGQAERNPLDWALQTMNDVRPVVPEAPFTPQIFGNAALEYGETNKNKRSDVDEAMHLIASKSHTQSTLNPYAQFNQPATVEQVKKARKVFEPMTLLHCSPTSDGAACAIIASEAFVKKHNLGPQAIEITAQVMATDSTLAFDPKQETKSCLEIAGADMTRAAARKIYAQAESLHAISKSASSMTASLETNSLHMTLLEGSSTAAQYNKIPVNTSGGLISKGHPLGATGLAQCAELTWQLRGWCDARQVANATRALQHNVGLGGAVVISLYTKVAGIQQFGNGWKDPRERFGYNPAVSCRGITEADVRKVISKKGSLIGLPAGLHQAAKEKLKVVHGSGTAKL